MKTLRKLKKLTDSYIPQMPKTYWIDINSNCNLKCIMCPQSNDNFKRKSKMSLNIFKSIIDDIYENQPLVKLYFSGEPLLHDKLFDMIEYASEKGCQTMVHTNATLLTKEISAKILSSSLTFISFSFDGCSPEKYEQLRPPAKFNKVKSNIIRYLDLRKKSCTFGPHVSVEIIKMKDTDKKIKEFVAQWRRKGVDKVSVRNCMTWLGNVQDRRIDEPDNYGFKPCKHPFVSGCILSDGTVVPCCMDAYGEVPLGNVEENSFRDIWFGERFGQLRKRMLTGYFNKEILCKGCYKTFSNSKKEYIKLFVPRFLAFTKSIF